MEPEREETERMHPIFGHPYKTVSRDMTLWLDSQFFIF